MNLDFTGELWCWRGPSPWHFVAVPEEGCDSADFFIAWDASVLDAVGERGEREPRSA